MADFGIGACSFEAVQTRHADIVEELVACSEQVSDTPAPVPASTDWAPASAWDCWQLLMIEKIHGLAVAGVYSIDTVTKVERSFDVSIEIAHDVYRSLADGSDS